MNLYETAKSACHSCGLPWTDPRTGVTYAPPSEAKIINEESCSLCGDNPSTSCGESGCPYNARS